MQIFPNFRLIFITSYFTLKIRFPWNKRSFIYAFYKKEFFKMSKDLEEAIGGNVEVGLNCFCNCDPSTDY